MPIARRFLSFPSSKRVFTEVSNYVHEPKVQGHWRSFAASVPSDKPIIRGQKVPKKERKVMVESFVDRYRATNLGKFPSVKIAQKEVGGSYYVIKRIVEELKAEAKMSSIDTKDKILQEEPTKIKPSTEHGIASSKVTIEFSSEIEEVSSSQIRNDSEPLADSKHITSETTHESSAEIEEVSSSQIRAHEQFNTNAQPVPTNGLDKPDSNNHLHAKVGPEASGLDENMNSTKFVKPTSKDDNTDQDVTENFLLNEQFSEVSVQVLKKPKIDAEDKTGSEDVLDFDVRLHKPEQKDQTDLDKLPRDLPQEQKDEVLLKQENHKDKEIQKKQSIWGNLKSLADGIINMWRKH